MQGRTIWWTHENSVMSNETRKFTVLYVPDANTPDPRGGVPFLSLASTCLHKAYLRFAGLTGDAMSTSTGPLYILTSEVAIFAGAFVNSTTANDSPMRTV